MLWKKTAQERDKQLREKHKAAAKSASETRKQRETICIASSQNLAIYAV